MNFTVTLGGMPPFNTLPPSYKLSKVFFLSSIGVHVILLALFTFGFGFSIYRTIKKLKNPKYTEEQEEQEEAEEENAKKAEEGDEKKETNDNLIYKFDEDELENQKNEGEEEQDKKEGENQEKEEEEDEQVKLMSQRMFQLEDKVLYFAPYVVGAVICVNAMVADFICLGCLVMAVVLYTVFNVFNLLKKTKIMSLLYIIPALGTFASYFMNPVALT